MACIGNAVLHEKHAVSVIACSEHFANQRPSLRLPPSWMITSPGCTDRSCLEERLDGAQVDWQESLPAVQCSRSWNAMMIVAKSSAIERCFTRPKLHHSGPATNPHLNQSAHHPACTRAPSSPRSGKGSWALSTSRCGPAALPSCRT